jgi:hypothetical protein
MLQSFLSLIDDESHCSGRNESETDSRDQTNEDSVG